MKNKTIFTTGILIFITFTSCSQSTIELGNTNLELVNREVVLSIKNEKSTLALNSQAGDGMAILKGETFETGIIELEIKGEDKPGQSFVGIAFNIQNDSTYEAIYFRPFNFKASESIRREHSIQYISHPKNTWRYLRTNSEGVYEAEYVNSPSPEDWFSVSVKIDVDNVRVYDKKSNTELLVVKRLEKQVSDKIGLWTGNNSKGEYRKVRLLE